MGEKEAQLKAIKARLIAYDKAARAWNKVIPLGVHHGQAEVERLDKALDDINGNCLSDLRYLVDKLDALQRQYDLLHTMFYEKSGGN